MTKRHHKSVHHRKGLTDAAKNFISSKIRKLRHEGVREDIAVAESYSIARRRGYRIPPRKRKR